MGQYYKVIVRRNGKDKVYNRDVDGNYTMAKLMEHSWWLNPMVNAITEKIYYADKPVQVIWMGDYATDFIQKGETFNGLTYNDICKYHKRCWGEKSKKKAVEPEVKETAVEEAVLRHFDEEPAVQETRTFEPVKKAEPEAKKQPVSDFDELSFDGFDFDNLD